MEGDLLIFPKYFEKVEEVLVPVIEYTCFDVRQAAVCLYQLYKMLYSVTFFCQGQLHVYMKLLRIISGF